MSSNREAIDRILRSRYSPNQRRAITSESKITAVKAGAGTGKTHTLSGRVAYLLATDRSLSLDQLAVLTFTDKAAQEMRERIEVILKAWGEELNDPRLTELSNRIGEAYISTIHSFSLRMIRESSMEMGLPLNCSILSEFHKDEFRRELAIALDGTEAQWFTRRLAGGDDGDVWVQRAEDLLITGASKVQELVTRVGDQQLAGMAIDAADRLGNTEGFSPERLWNLQEGSGWLDELLDKMLSSMAHWLVMGSSLAAETLQAISIEVEPPDPSDRHGMLEVIKRFINESKGARGKKKDAMNERLGCLDLRWLGLKDDAPVSNVRKAMEEVLKPVLDVKNMRERRRENGPPGEEELLGLCNRICALGWEVWNRRRLSSGQLSFQDLINLAGKAVREEPLKSRFRHVLVDEFQDTDWLQFELVKSFAEGGATVFVVGDLKQSIYRFRDTDLSLFQRLISEARPIGGEVSLTESRRSSPEVIGTVNRIFSKAFHPSIGTGIEEGYEPLVHPEHPDAVPKGVLIALDEEDEEETDKTLDRKVARASRILGMEFLRMMEMGFEVKDAEGPRSCRWDDFAVLVSSRTQYPRVSRSFQELGIPHVLHSSREYGNRFEIRDLMALMAAIGGDRSDLTVLTAASSPFLGRFLGNPIRNDRLEEALEAGRLAISRLADIARTAGAWAVVDHILKDQSWLDDVRPQDRERVVLNLRRAREILRDYQKVMGQSLIGAAEHLRSVMSGSSMEEPPASRSQAVNVMTVHAAKGLEFPITAVILIPAKNGGSQEKIVVSKHLGAVPSSSLVKRMCGQEGVLSNAHRRLESSALNEESLRIFYVACTRAKEKLILVAPSMNNKNLWVQKTMEALSSLGEGIYINTSPPEGRVDPGSQKESSLPSPVDLPPREGAMLQMSATSYSVFRFCPVAYRITFRQGLVPRWDSELGDMGPGGSDLGTLAHWVMRHWDGNPDRLKGMMDDTASMPMEVLMASRKTRWKDTLLDWLYGFALSETGEEFRDLLRRGAKREVPFRIPVAGRFRMVGSMDLFLHAPEGPIIRDYKITHEENPLQELYTDQMRFYGLAAWLITGQEPDMALWRLRPVNGRYERIPVEGGNWQEMESQLLDIAKKALGPYEPKTHMCSVCRWGKSCGYKKIIG
ncbi:UvrD-helicase domain-containing protein [Thermanaerovibrio velox]|nr:UvrD-helicase domain-containing protein [Thermanaerovibrio velox]